MSETPSGFELYIKSPQGFELAYRINKADLPAGIALIDQLILTCDRLHTEGFVRSERLDKPARGGGNPNWKPREVPKDAHGEEVKCPRCEGPVWDNRPKKATGEYKPNSPDFACKDKTCGGKIWPPRESNGTENPFDSEPDPVSQFV